MVTGRDNNFPEVNKRCSGKLKSFKWYTEELKEQKHVVDALRVVQNCVNDAETGQVITLLKNVYRKNLRKAKIFVNDNFVMSATNRSKAVWHISNTELGREKKSTNCQNNISADDFNNYFVNIPLELSKQLQQSALTNLTVNSSVGMRSK